MSLLNRNAILTGWVDSFCLVCESHLRCDDDALRHVAKPIHRNNLNAAGFLNKFKEDHVRKVKNGYYCEYCNSLMTTSAKLGPHIADESHATNKARKPLKREGNGVLAFNNVFIRENAWHGLVDDTCAVCDAEFDNPEIHKTGSAHVLKLVLIDIEFSDQNVYRKVDDSTFQCLTCNVVCAQKNMVTHFNTVQHRDLYELCCKADKAKANEPKETSKTVKDDKTIVENEILRKEDFIRTPVKEKPQNPEVEKPKEQTNKEIGTLIKQEVKKLNLKVYSANKDKPGKIDQDIQDFGANEFLVRDNVGLYWCILCDWAMDKPTVSVHMKKKHHLTMLRLHETRTRGKRFESDNVPEENEEIKIKIPRSIMENNPIIWLRHHVAYCIVCSKSIEFEFNSIENHKEEHKKELAEAAKVENVKTFGSNKSSQSTAHLLLSAAPMNDSESKQEKENDSEEDIEIKLPRLDIPIKEYKEMIWLNNDSRVAYCRACSKSIEFEFDSIVNHKEEHEKKVAQKDSESKQEKDSSTGPKNDSETKKENSNAGPKNYSESKQEKDSSAGPKNDTETKKEDSSADPKNDTETEKEDLSADPKNDTKTKKEDLSADPKNDTETEKEDLSADPKNDTATKKEDSSADPKNDTETKKEDSSADPKNDTETKKEDSSAAPMNDSESKQEKDLSAGLKDDTESKIEKDSSADPKHDTETKKEDSSADPQNDTETKKEDSSADPKNDTETKKEDSSADPKNDTETKKEDSSADPKNDTETKKEDSSADPKNDTETKKEDSSADPKNDTETKKEDSSADFKNDTETKKEDSSADPKNDTETKKEDSSADPKNDTETKKEDLSADPKNGSESKKEKDSSAGPQNDSESKKEKDSSAGPQDDSESKKEKDSSAGPQNDSESKTQKDSSAGPQNDSEFKAQKDSSAGPQNDSESKKEKDSSAGPQDDSESKKEKDSSAGPQNDSESKTQKDSSAGPQNDSESKTQKDSSAGPQNDSESKKDKDSSVGPKNDTETKKEKDSSAGLKNDSETKKKDSSAGHKNDTESKKEKDSSVGHKNDTETKKKDSSADPKNDTETKKEKDSSAGLKNDSETKKKDSSAGLKNDTETKKEKGSSTCPKKDSKSKKEDSSVGPKNDSESKKEKKWSTCPKNDSESKKDRDSSAGPKKDSKSKKEKESSTCLKNDSESKKEDPSAEPKKDSESKKRKGSSVRPKKDSSASGCTASKNDFEREFSSPPPKKPKKRKVKAPHYSSAGSACEGDSEIEIFSKLHDMNYNYNNNTAFCRVCVSKIPPTLKSMKEHVKGVSHKNKVAKVVVPHQAPVEQKPFCEFVNNFSTVENILVKDVIINEQYCLNIMSFFLLTRHGARLRCQACEVSLTKPMVEAHKRSPHHERAMDHASVVMSERTEFIREIRPNIFHCGFCNQLERTWRNMETHLKSTSHRECKIAAYWRVQEYTPLLTLQRGRMRMEYVVFTRMLTDQLNRNE